MSLSPLVSPVGQTQTQGANASRGLGVRLGLTINTRPDSSDTSSPTGQGVCVEGDNRGQEGHGGQDGKDTEDDEARAIYSSQQVPSKVRNTGQGGQKGQVRGLAC